MDPLLLLLLLLLFTDMDRPSLRHRNKVVIGKNAEERIETGLASHSMVGGKETGTRMSHYIVPGGAFEQSYDRLEATGWKLNLQSAPIAGSSGNKQQKNKTKFICSECQAAAWGKPGLLLICGACFESHAEPVLMVPE